MTDEAVQDPKSVEGAPASSEDAQPEERSPQPNSPTPTLPTNGEEPLRSGVPLGAIDVLLLAIILAAAWLIVFRGLGDYPLWDPWEPKYPQTVREMRERGEWITPYFRDYIRWTKPILVYWGIHLSVMTTGSNDEFAARAPGAAVGVLCGLCLFWTLRRLVGRTAAIAAPIALFTMPYFFLIARESMPDIHLAGFLGIAMCFFALGRFSGEHRRAYYLLFYAAWALAVLAKGPVAGAIGLGSLLLFWVIDFDAARLWPPRAGLARLWGLAKQYELPLGIPLFILIAAPWYLAMWWNHSDEFMGRFVQYENLDRFQTTIRGLDGEAGYYFEGLITSAYPWIGFIAVGLAFLAFPRSGVASVGSQPRVDDSMRLGYYFFAWAFTPIFIFTVAGTKLDHYMMPVVPSLAALAGLIWHAYRHDPDPRWTRGAFVGGALFTIVAAREHEGDLHTEMFDVINSSHIVYDPFLGPWLKLFMLGSLGVAALAVLLPRSRIVVALGLGLAVANATYMTQVVVADHSDRRSCKQHVQLIHRFAPEDAKVVLVGHEQPSLDFYHGSDNYEWLTGDEVLKLNQIVDALGDDPARLFVVCVDNYERGVLHVLGQRTRARWFVLHAENTEASLLTCDERLLRYAVQRDALYGILRDLGKRDVEVEDALEEMSEFELWGLFWRLRAVMRAHLLGTIEVDEAAELGDLCGDADDDDEYSLEELRAIDAEMKKLLELAAAREER